MLGLAALQPRGTHEVRRNDLRHQRRHLARRHCLIRHHQPLDLDLRERRYTKRPMVMPSLILRAHVLVVKGYALKDNCLARRRQPLVKLTDTGVLSALTLCSPLEVASSTVIFSVHSFAWLTLKRCIDSCTTA